MFANVSQLHPAAYPPAEFRRQVVTAVSSWTDFKDKN